MQFSGSSLSERPSSQAGAEQLRVHTLRSMSGKDMEAGNVSMRLHHGGPQGAKLKA